MRKAAVMIGFGAFFLTLALLMRFYAYPKLAVIPQDQNTQQTVTDDNASFFDADTIKPGHGKIITKATVVADDEASKKASDELGRDVVVLNQWQSTDNVGADGKTKTPPMSAMTQRVAVDRSTGEAVKWSGNSLNRDGQNVQGVNITGQTIKFPFQVDKNKTYEYWDTTLAKAFPMKFAGEEKVDGMSTYKFTQSIPKTKFATKDMPGEVFGLPKGSQMADRFYANERTAWVDPETGVMMKLQEKQKQTLEVPNAPAVNAMDTTSTMTDDTVKSNVDEYKTKAQQLKILRLWAPILLGLIGLFALCLGLFASVRAGKARAARRRDDEGRDLDHDDTVVMNRQQGGAHAAGDEVQH